MVNAPVAARERDIDVTETGHDRPSDYQKLMRVTVEGPASSAIGRRHPVRRLAAALVEIKGIPVEAEFGSHMLYVTNQDKPGFIGRFGATLAEAGINIATFHLGRAAPGGDAICLVSVDEPVPGGGAGDGPHLAAGHAGNAARVLIDGRRPGGGAGLADDLPGSGGPPPGPARRFRPTARDRGHPGAARRRGAVGGDLAHRAIRRRVRRPGRREPVAVAADAALGSRGRHLLRRLRLRDGLRLGPIVPRGRRATYLPRPPRRAHRAALLAVHDADRAGRAASGRAERTARSGWERNCRELPVHPLAAPGWIRAAGIPPGLDAQLRDAVLRDLHAVPHPASPLGQFAERPSSGRWPRPDT